ncbi:MAG TPA: Rieske 2Fe-2S domain-containing protein [Candidatus Limnocylindria bacterium]|jgi:nitrite reductase/ring-hydroxylating ferredoxin subunit|nr:Rieske 2Fe-2S domain-containing protein [Candidatus Limnocylindria bacterium]
MNDTTLEPPESARGEFPLVPASWFHLCHQSELERGPLEVELGGRQFAGYRTESGQAVVLSGRCSHLGAHLARGKVCGERLVCPLHGWEFGPGGVCERIPAGDPVPGFARQIRYPVGERGGHLFFFNRPQARFPLPFFDGVSPSEILPAQPFELQAYGPWYFVGANGFDLQHFRTAHDRVLLGPPEVTTPSPYAKRIVATFGVCGNSIPDRLTRMVAGPQVTMDVTVWGGTIVFVKARFARTTSFGIFNVLPQDPDRTLGRVIVWVRRSDNILGRLAFDPLNAAIRRLFIKNFLHADLPRTAGLRYRPGNLIAADAVMADYFHWLENLCRAAPAADPLK